MNLQEKLNKELDGLDWIPGNEVVSVKETAHTIESLSNPYRSYSSNRPINNGLKRLNKTNYVDTRTGEIKTYNTHAKRSYQSFNRSFNLLKDKINANFSGQKNESFLTLTFADRSRACSKDEKHNKSVVKSCKHDLDNFLKRLRRRVETGNHKLIHIIIMEPQHSGSPHFHILLKLLHARNLDLSHDLIQDLWKLGFSNVKPLNNISAIPAYFHAHLTDMPLEELSKLPNGAETVERVVEGTPKKFVKGARLRYFPKDINYFSSSKDLKKPTKSIMKAEEARKRAQAKGLKLTYKTKYSFQLSENDSREYRREEWS